jgi:ABC-type transport system involved in cytochrome c biogenesis ATPase subunit
MKILSFQLKDNTRKWELHTMVFNKLTLLVGASGVGKTQILRAIHTLKEIAEGNSLNGVEWNVTFERLDKKIYNWYGAFETKEVSLFIDEFENETNSNKPKLIYERLQVKDKEQIIDRNTDKILFFGNQTIKLSPEKSVIHLLKEEDAVKPVFLELMKINLSNQFGFSETKMQTTINKDILTDYDTLSKIIESEFKTSIKLYIAYINNHKVFNEIKQRFLEIFPTIEDIRFSEQTKDSKTAIDIQIKEYNVDFWISSKNISWGMMRTLKQLSELYLCSEGTVFLIDEFENSLGINCIDEITHDILNSHRQLQFILTSHHPYIINSISHNNWKLITRNAGAINTHDVAKFNIGKSKHEAFMQLIQLEEYQTGTEQL